MKKEGKENELTKSETREIPNIEKLYKAIPFPDDEFEAAFFIAGIAEAHKFLTRALHD